jgi:hypothetical protein
VSYSHVIEEVHKTDRGFWDTLETPKVLLAVFEVVYPGESASGAECRWGNLILTLLAVSSSCSNGARGFLWIVLEVGRDCLELGDCVLDCEDGVDDCVDCVDDWVVCYFFLPY